MNLRLWIARALWCGAGSLSIGCIASLLALVLSSGGDRDGSAAVRGVALVAFVVCILAFVSLVVMLAVNELLRPAENSDNAPSSREGD